MKVKDIIESFKYNKGKFEENSIIEARKKQKEVTEELLIELEKVANNIELYSQEKDYFFPIYAMYLLAEFREKKAFPIIIKLISQDKNEVDKLLGDLITEDLKRILASTFDGNIECLYNIIANLELNEFVRSAAFCSLEILEKNNIIKEGYFIEKIEEMLQNELKNDNSILIADIVVYIEENKLYDKIELVKKLYEANRVNETVIGGYDSFIDGIYGNKKYSGEKNLIEDTVKSLSCWACFDNEKEEIDFEKMFKKTLEIGETEVPQNKKVGRNEPCPCRQR